MKNDAPSLAKVYSQPRERPPRRDLLDPLLDGTKRAFVPIRRTFIQQPDKGQQYRGSSLSLLARSSSVLDAYLLIHALASSSEPYVARYPVATWVQLARLDEASSFESGKSHWSKLTSRLCELNLIFRERKGNQVEYGLLSEYGSGEPYSRPRDTVDGNWFKLPYAYWLDEFDSDLNQPEKLMLLISLDQKNGFKLPFNRAYDWYGVAESTARRGIRGLETKGLLEGESGFVVDPRSPTGWSEEFRYTLLGSFSKSAIKKAHDAQISNRKNAATVDGGRT